MKLPLGRALCVVAVLLASLVVVQAASATTYCVDDSGCSGTAEPDLQTALDAPKARRAVGVMPDPLPAEAPVARVTLTRASIVSARTILITVTGDEKRALLEQAIADGQSSKLPIGRVLSEVEQPIDIHWAP